MELTRRRLLSGVAATVSTGMLAGCIGDGSTDGRDSGGAAAQASFFVFGEIRARVAGDTAEADLLVPTGQHGHGWSPSPSVREDIRGADLFVHGMTGFQPWVDDIRSDLEADGADVTTVDVSAGLDMLEAGGEHNNHEGESDHENHDNHDNEGGHDDSEGHDHGDGMDPHFWMDPLRVKAAVSNVREGLIDVDPDNADAYADNADAFRSDLDNLHERIDDTVDGASKDVLLVAGHDAMQYFGDRYGVRVEALTNVSPDDRPTARDVETAQEIIDEHDLAYVCADPLESQTAANQLVEETDATEVLELTAMPGLEEEWDEEDWGYIDVMENVNLPTLERALDA